MRSTLQQLIEATNNSISVKQETCCFCGESFGNVATKNEHILISHFERKHCTGCNNDLISIGDKWYQLHNDIDCNIIKTEPDFYDEPLDSHNDLDDLELSAENEQMFEDALDMIDTMDPLERSPSPAFDDPSSPAFDDFEFNNDISSESDHPLDDNDVPANDSDGWSCRICSKTFTYRHNLMRHYRNVEHIEPNIADMGTSESNRWLCTTCGQTFTIKSNLRRHQRQFHGTDVGQADEMIPATTTATITTKTLKRESDHSSSTFSPPISQLRQSTSNMAGPNDGNNDKLPLISIDSMNEPIFSCALCQKTFTFEHNLHRHERNIHNVTDSQWKKKESSETAMESSEKNIKNEENIDELLVPLTSYVEPSSSQSKPWSCKKCLRVFTLRSNLIRHMRQIKCVRPIQPDTPKKSWACDLCPQSFTFQQNLLRHRKHIHQISGKEAKGSVELSLSTTNNPNTTQSENNPSDTISDTPDSPLQLHFKVEMAESTAETPKDPTPSELDDLTCGTCFRTFTFRVNLKRHLRTVKCVPPEKTDQSTDVNAKSTNNSQKMSKNVKNTTRRQWRCNICSKSFTFANNLYRHKHDVHKQAFVKRKKRPLRRATTPPSPSELYSCDICQQTFTFRNNLIRHQKNVRCQAPTQEENTEADESAAQQWICDYCGDEFTSRNCIMKHMRRQHPDACMVDCNVCSMPFNSLVRLEVHMREKHNIAAATINVQVPCKYCSATFTSKHELDKHKRVQHLLQLEEDHIFKCAQCPALFNSNAVRKMHLMKRHKRPTRIFKELFKCYICAETFKFPASVVSHMESHKLDGDVKCCYESCTDHFSSSKKMYYHLQKHLRDLDAKQRCDKCKRSYSEWTFESHRCIINNPQEFMCHYCGKTWATKHLLEVHMNSHTGNKPYKCKYCDMAFTKCYTRNRHQNTHTGTKPCKCTVAGCDRAFGQHIDLYRHLYKAHGIFKKKYPCTICEQVFPENSLLRKHLQSHENF